MLAFLLLPRRALSAAVATAAAKISTTDFLISSPYSFPPTLASKLSPHIAHLKSTTKPESVLNFLHSQNFSTPEIHKLISWCPRLLCANVPKSIAPKFRSLSSLNFTPSEIVEIVMSNPCVLTRDFDKSILPKITLWTSLLGSRQFVLKLFRRKQWFLPYKCENQMLPNLEILRQHGVADDRVALLLRKLPRFIFQSPESLKSLIARAEGYGVASESGFFIWALDVLFRNSKANFEAKMGVLREMGWSEEEFFSAFRKAPQVLSNSALMLKKKMEFLVGENGWCEASYVAERPVLLTCSLENRLIPRCRVIQVLKSKKINTNRYTLISIMAMTDQKFLEKFVLPNMKEVPEISGELTRLSSGARLSTV